RLPSRVKAAGALLLSRNSDLVQEALVVAPALTDFNEQAQIDMAVQEHLDIAPRRAPNLLQLRARSPDNDRTPLWLLPPYHTIDAGDGITLLPAFGRNCGDIRDLLAGQLQHLFADDFGHHQPLRLIGERVIRKESWPRRQGLEQPVDEQFNAVPC